MDSLFDVAGFIIPLLSIITICLIGLVEVYVNVRKRFPVKVNCWFCGSNCRVNFDQKNSWTCVRCEQYNGFKPDGSYNRDMLEQYNELLNTSVYNKYNERRNDIAKTNGLCITCNYNQQLKIQQLASFTPKNESTFDQEIEEYSKSLEEAYKVCQKCNKVVKRVINKTKTLLLTQPLVSIRSQGLNLLNLNISSNGISSYRKRMFLIDFIRFMITILSVTHLFFMFNALDYDHNCKQGTICYYILDQWSSMWSYFMFIDERLRIIPLAHSFYIHVFSQIHPMSPLDLSVIYAYVPTTLFISSIKDHYIKNNSLLTFSTLFLSSSLIFISKFRVPNHDLWQTVLCLISFILSTNIQEHLDIANSFEYINGIKVCVAVISLLVSLRRSSSTISRKIVNQSLTCELLDEAEQNNNTMSNGKITWNSVNKTTTVKKNYKMGASNIYTDNKKRNDQKITNMFDPKALVKQDRHIPVKSYLKDYGASKNNVYQSSRIFGENNNRFPVKNKEPFESLFEHIPSSQTCVENIPLGRLNLCENDRSTTPLSSSSLFSLRRYNTKVSDLFIAKQQLQVNKRPIIAPSRLSKSVIPSWTAGEYWSQSKKYMVHMNSNYTALSRTSSRSSGFESHCSSPNQSICNSRENSICGDFDRSSVISEPTCYFNNFPQKNFVFGYRFNDPHITQIYSPTSNRNPFGISKNAICDDIFLRHRDNKHSMFSNYSVDNNIRELRIY